MDASEYKEYIFGMLFLKRVSDVFEVKMAELRDRFKAQMRPDEQINELLEDPNSYFGNKNPPAWGFPKEYDNEFRYQKW